MEEAKDQQMNLVPTTLVETTAVDTQPIRNTMTEVAKTEVLGRIRGAIAVAREYPRDEATSLARILMAISNKGLAEKALYAYPRGKERITGPSIRLAEAIAQRWTNIEFGVREIEQRDGYSVVESYCWDLEANVRKATTFTVKHERKANQKIVRLTDPRDIYEHVANSAARRMRACILAVVPKEIIDRAVVEVKKVLTSGDKRTLPERTATMLAAFEKLGVRKELIEARLNHVVAHVDEEELFELNNIGNSLHDKQSRRSDWFDVPTESDRADDLTAKLESETSSRKTDPIANKGEKK